MAAESFPSLLLLLTIAAASLLCVRVASGVTLTSDVRALHALKLSFGNTEALNSWVGDPCLEIWSGITCSSGRPFQSIVAMDLSGMDLTGEIGDRLGDLAGLQFLSFANNRLTGHIPISIGKLTALKYLHLDNNQMTGPIPAELGQLLQLETLTLSYNKFSDNLPASLEALPKLMHIDISNTHIGKSSSPPDIFSHFWTWITIAWRDLVKQWSISHGELSLRGRFLQDAPSVSPAAGPTAGGSDAAPAPEEDSPEPIVESPVTSPPALPQPTIVAASPPAVEAPADSPVTSPDSSPPPVADDSPSASPPAAVFPPKESPSEEAPPPEEEPEPAPAPRPPPPITFPAPAPALAPSAPPPVIPPPASIPPPAVAPVLPPASAPPPAVPVAPPLEAPAPSPQPVAVSPPPPRPPRSPPPVEIPAPPPPRAPLSSPPPPVQLPPPPVAPIPVPAPAPSLQPPSSPPPSPPPPPVSGPPPASPPPVACPLCAEGQAARLTNCQCVYPLFVNFRLSIDYSTFTPDLSKQFLADIALNLNASAEDMILLDSREGSVLADTAMLPPSPLSQLTVEQVEYAVDVLTEQNSRQLALPGIYGTVEVLNVTSPSVILGQLSPPPPSPPPSSDDKDEDGGGLSTVVIIGIAAGGGGGAFLLILLIVFCCFCRRRDPKPVPDAGKDYEPPRPEVTGWAQASSTGTMSSATSRPVSRTGSHPGSAPGSGRLREASPSSGSPLISKREARDAPATTTTTPPISAASVTGASATTAAVGVSAVAAAGLTRKDSKIRRDGIEEVQVPVIPPPKKAGPAIGAQAFSVADLQVATKSFSMENLIGEGPMGSLYRADFAQGRALAIKKMDPSTVEGMSDEDFKGIVANIARLRHPNIIELHGYSVQHGQRLLAFQFFPSGSIYDYLHDPRRQPFMTWEARIKIAIGCARGLEYIHEAIAPPVVHRNFKSTNVQLDRELNPHVADCGMAVFNPIGVDTMSQGGFTYSAPEYTMSGVYTAASDVYSYGVVLLEVLTGRKPVDLSLPKSEQSLVRWAAPLLNDLETLEAIVDPKLPGNLPDKIALTRFAEVITRCIQPEPELRPPMSKVAQDLVKRVARSPTKSPGSNGNSDRGGGSSSFE